MHPIPHTIRDNADFLFSANIAELLNFKSGTKWNVSFL